MAVGWGSWLRQKADELLSSKPEATPEPSGFPVPVIWLLGKTGAGKSSLIQAITGATEAEIGNGFVACTKTARAFEFPTEEPVMRFLDTRGLGEVAYDPTADLQEIKRAANVILVVLRLDDPVQGVVSDALRSIRKKNAKLPVIVVHTAPDCLPSDEARARMQHVNQKEVEAAWGKPLPKVVLDLSQPAEADLVPLHAELDKVMPLVVEYLTSAQPSTPEEAEFLRHRALVLGYTASATAGGAIPGIGIFSVPSLQVAMISALASRYEVDWGRKALTQFAAALGGGVIGAQAMGLGLRELAKLVPVVGQTVAPVVAASLSGAATWALGRAAAYYLYQLKHANAVDEVALREIYAEALKGKSGAPD